MYKIIEIILIQRNFSDSPILATSPFLGKVYLFTRLAASLVLGIVCQMIQSSLAQDLTSFSVRSIRDYNLKFQGSQLLVNFEMKYNALKATMKLEYFLISI